MSRRYLAIWWAGTRSPVRATTKRRRSSPLRRSYVPSRGAQCCPRPISGGRFIQQTAQ
jgi:hypothetical protein